MLARVGAAVDLEVDPGDYWLVVAADATYVVAGDPNTGAQGAVTSGGGTFPQLPGTFPAGNTASVAGTWSLDLTALPR